jgi:hypothetical protein
VIRRNCRESAQQRVIGDYNMIRDLMTKLVETRRRIEGEIK